MGKVCTKHILRLLWKMVENMFFLDSEHIGMGGKCWFIQFITGSIQWRGGQVQMVLDSPPIPPKEYPCYFINPLK